ncbi:hypothetical protein RJ639_014078 [Escallonia herrerae]|uniref:Uncharacterized protein n=1 Tax=Escallonia herrerae TaxID=1293975 RepID=A0AA89AMU6_9ASTE|nr:hypothetical protein RJ639_014078 [Escallonia herrerae]
MSDGPQSWLLSLAIFLLVLSAQNLQARLTEENGVKSAIFLSPKFVLKPGSVANKFYFDIGFPRGHIGIKSFNAEVVDEAGNPIPLHETYLHHWVLKLPSTLVIWGSTSLILSLLEILGFAIMAFHPYGIEVGDPKEIPAGYEEKWLLNVHAIDTRGAEDRLGCTECKCDLYNVTVDEYGRPLSQIIKED